MRLTEKLVNDLVEAGWSPQKANHELNVMNRTAEEIMDLTDYLGDFYDKTPPADGAKIVRAIAQARKDMDKAYDALVNLHRRTK